MVESLTENRIRRMQHGYKFSFDEVFKLPGVSDAVSLLIAQEVAEKTGTEADDIEVILWPTGFKVMKKDGTSLYGYPTETHEGTLL